MIAETYRHQLKAIPDLTPADDDPDQECGHQLGYQTPIRRPGDRFPGGSHPA